MSCSYDADWQRRKAVLIRSLFHDIPILSPVEEESNDSSQQYYIPTQEVFPSPPRPYSPLPPLIIEEVPIANKYDEPEEYYNKLYKKIKKIYKKLFIEKRNFSSIDYGSNYSDSAVNEDSDGSDEKLDFSFLESHSPDNGRFVSVIEDEGEDAREATRSSASTKSNGYGADFESMDTAIIDVVNYTASNEDGLMISDEEESNSEIIDGDGIRDEDSGSSRSSDNKGSSRERIDDPEFREIEASHNSVIDDYEMTEGEESNKPEDEQSYEEEGSDIEHEIIEETRQTAESDTVRIDNPIFSGGEEYHSSTDDDEETESKESNETEDEQQPNNVTKMKQDSLEKNFRSKEMEETGSEDGNELMDSNVEPMESDVETSDSSEGPAYRQITTAAMIHFDGSPDAAERESRVYEDSDKSVILPTRFARVLATRNVNGDDRIEVLTVLDENADSKTTPSFYTDESENTEEDFEEMATPQPKAKEGRIMETRTPHVDAPEEKDEKMSTPQPEHVEEDAKGMGNPQPAARDEETGEMRIPLPEGTGEDVEEMGTPRLGAPEGDHEEITTPQPEFADEDVEGMGSPQPAARHEEAEEMGIPQPEATQENSPEEDDEEINTPHPESVEEGVEGIGSPRPADRHEEAEEMEIPNPESIQEDVEEMGTSRLDSHEEDDEEMTTPQESGEEEIEGMGSPEPPTRYKESKATEVDVGEMGSPHPIEQMRTPRPDLSHGTIPTTHQSHSESTSEHTAVQLEQTALTSSTQDGARNNMSELQTSNDMNEILTSIFNESLNKDGTPISGRKRKYVDRSVQAVQTSKVTWDEMRANFFVGTPKIFRLCACPDHICY